MLEDSRTCLERELKEELSADAEAGRMLWVAENFFTYRQKQYHELGFYYLVHSRTAKQSCHPEPFFGPEGKHLTYQWIPLEDVCKVNLHPHFLREALQKIPQATERLIVSDYKL